VVVLGFLLTGVSWGFLTLVALGTFGPGILRELGWLKDKDEFERRAARRAGYHAYLVGGFVTFLLVAYLRSGERSIEHPGELVTLILVACGSRGCSVPCWLTGGRGKPHRES
jgi:hypothetical protein